MHVLPVIDLKGGLVVRGIGGERQHYGPIQSRLAANAAPANVSRGLVEHLDATEVYVADLDAIAGHGLSLAALAEIAAAPLRMWLDAGIRSAHDVERLYDLVGDSVAAVIVGLETVPSPEELSSIRAALCDEHAVFSLDLKHGQPLAGETWAGQDARTIANAAIAANFRRIIVLDLADVGRDAGSQGLDLCRSIRALHGSIQLISGGGVRQYEDLVTLANAGCDVALVASALHDGRLTRQHIRQASELADTV